MDACLIQSEPARETSPIRFDAHQWLRWGFFATISVGLLWRCVRYLGQFPIWGDEAMLLLNILQRDYLGLTQHLRYAQVAPVLFLWLEKSALLVFGPAEWSVHLFPWLAGLIALGVFWRTCQTSFTPTVAGLAVGVLAVSYYPVRHACEVKPYAFDLCFAVLFLWVALERLRHLDKNRWLIALVVLTPFAVFASYPSVFVAGSVSLVLLPTMRNASWTQRSWYALLNLALLASFLIHYGMVAHQQVDAEEAQRTREFLRNYWKDAFPPENLFGWPLWLVRVFTGNMLAYPIGAHNGGSTLTFLLVLCGSYKLWRDSRHSLLALCWLPFALNLVAAILNKYPFGDSARITLHLAPFICVLMAHGLAQVLEWVRAPEWRTHLQVAFYVALLTLGLIGVVRDVLKPFKTEHDREVRQLARDIGEQVAPGERVLLCHSRDEELIAEFVWYLRTQSLDLRWQSDGVAAGTYSFWLVQSSNEPIDWFAIPDVPLADRWITQVAVRRVPPENNKMPPMHCRWARVVRE